MAQLEALWSTGGLQYYNNQWGTVCNDGFSRSDGRVACRQLEFDDIVNYGRSESLNFDRGSSLKPIWLDNVRCRGTESRLISCTNNGYDHDVGDCSHADDVGVVCQPIAEGSLRLQGGISTYGRLEVYHEGKWGTVCDDGFSQTDADVACRQLGSSMAKGYCWGAVSAFGLRQASNDVPIWLRNLRCTSADTALINCSRGVGVKSCTHTEDVAVVCTRRSSCNGFTTTSGGGSGGGGGGGGNTVVYGASGGSISVLGIIGCCAFFCCYAFCCHHSDDKQIVKVHSLWGTKTYVVKK